MKKILTAIFSLILVAQLPMNATKFVPTAWLKSFHYGLKWSELMMYGYPGSADAQEDVIPQGYVTTTVTMANAIPDALDVQATVDKYLCEIEYREELAEQARDAIKAQMALQKMRMREVRIVRVIHM